MFVIHYHNQSGLIRNWGDDDGSMESFAGPDYAIVRFDEAQTIDPALQQIDVATGEVVDRPPEEIEADKLAEAARVVEADRAYAKYLQSLLKEE